MSKSLMISMKPQHAYNIIVGKKTLELRTWIPKGYVGWVYVYVTKTIRNYKMSYYYQPKNQENIYRLHGNIPFRFWFDEYDTYDFDNHGVNLYTDVEEYNVFYNDLVSLCLDYREIETYGKGKTLYAWLIKDLEIFDTPKKLSEFQNYVGKVDDTPEWAITSSWQIFHRPLEKAPKKMQWVYVKELENDK